MEQLLKMKLSPYLFMKAIFYSLISLSLFYVLEYGFVFDTSEKLIIPFLLSVLTTIVIIIPKLKRFILFFSMICLIFMLLTSLFNLLDISKIIGNFGFSLLTVTVVLYLPQIIKNGYIEKF